MAPNASTISTARAQRYLGAAPYKFSPPRPWLVTSLPPEEEKRADDSSSIVSSEETDQRAPCPAARLSCNRSETYVQCSAALCVGTDRESASQRNWLGYRRRSFIRSSTDDGRRVRVLRRVRAAERRRPARYAPLHRRSRIVSNQHFHGIMVIVCHVCIVAHFVMVVVTTAAESVSSLALVGDLELRCVRACMRVAARQNTR